MRNEEYQFYLAKLTEQPYKASLTGDHLDVSRKPLSQKGPQRLTKTSGFCGFIPPVVHTIWLKKLENIVVLGFLYA